MPSLEQTAEPVPTSVENGRRPRLILADEHLLFLDGLKGLLGDDFDVAAAVADGHAAVTAAERLQPDVALMDIDLPLLNGIDAARQIRSVLPETKILFITAHTERMYVEGAFRAGGSGYVLKQAIGSSELFEVIAIVLAGARYLSPQIGITVEELKAHPASRRTLDGLTAREREVLQLVGEGKSMKEIAWLLRISVRTVEFHKQSLFQDLGLRTTAELIRYSLNHKILI
jgi:DNA-binding NarL/FixJ family response regulator